MLNETIHVIPIGGMEGICCFPSWGELIIISAIGAFFILIIVLVVERREEKERERVLKEMLDMAKEIVKEDKKFLEEMSKH